MSLRGRFDAQTGPARSRAPFQLYSRGSLPLLVISLVDGSGARGREIIFEQVYFRSICAVAGCPRVITARMAAAITSCARNPSR